MRARPLAVVVLIGVAACSGTSFDQPKASSFTAGSCRDLAPSVLSLGKTLHGLSSKVPSTSQRDALKTSQADVRSRQSAVPAGLAPTVQDLVTTVGIVRLRTDTNSYDKSLATDAMSAYQKLVKACTQS